MKYFILSIALVTSVFCNAQTLPFTFESDITTEDFENFDGGTATVIANPQQGGINTSATVAQIVRDGGTIWSGSKVQLANNLDFSTEGAISMKVFTTAPVGTIVKFKLEGVGQTEIDIPTTVSGAWEEITWDFTGTPSDYNYVVFMFDFGNVGDGSATSTFLFDDVMQGPGAPVGEQLDLPVTFDDSEIEYSFIDFGGNASVIAADPTDATNTVVCSTKTNTAELWAGTTIGTNAGFATNIPLTLTDSQMSVRVWSPTAGTPVRLKVENANDAAQTCETETNTTVAGDWETLIFDFTSEAPGTAALSLGLDNGWIYNKASIFFNFGTTGADAGEATYYFDDVMFGEVIIDNVSESSELTVVNIYPNPSSKEWNISTENGKISKVELYSLIGDLVSEFTVDAATLKIINGDLPVGMYIAKVYSGAEFKTYRLVKD